MASVTHQKDVLVYRRSVKVPAPVYYAHLAAFRARLLLMGEDQEATDTMSMVTEEQLLMGLHPVHDRVKNRMYYI